MLGSSTIDDLDLMLVTALQLAPRADWQRIGRVLNVSASTAARRWERLTEAGLAWLECTPLRLSGPPLLLVFIEVTCVAGQLSAVAAEFAEESHVINIGYTTGERDLILTVGFADQVSLARYLSFRLGRMPGVAATRTHLATALHTEGSRWRLDRLDERQRAVLLQDQPVAPPAVHTDLDATDQDLVMELTRDCRQSAAELAARTGLSPTTVRRRLARLHAERAVVYRCEVARFVSGWPVGVTMVGSVPPERAAAITAQIVGLRETRVCTSLVGRDNLLFSLWLRSLDEVHAFESRLVKRFPELSVSDRIVTVWQLKLGGHILDPLGRHLRAVPLRPWSSADVDEAERRHLARLRGG